MEYLGPFFPYSSHHSRSGSEPLVHFCIVSSSLPFLALILTYGTITCEHLPRGKKSPSPEYFCRTLTALHLTKPATSTLLTVNFDLRQA